MCIAVALIFSLPPKLHFFVSSIFESQKKRKCEHEKSFQFSVAVRCLSLVMKEPCTETSVIHNKVYASPATPVNSSFPFKKMTLTICPDLPALSYQNNRIGPAGVIDA